VQQHHRILALDAILGLQPAGHSRRAPSGGQRHGRCAAHWAFDADDDASAKADVSALCRELGFEPVDTGKLDRALHLEHMTLLWVKMVRGQGYSSGLVWAALRR